MAYHEALQRTVLFCGNNSPFPFFVQGDTWLWDGTAWVEHVLQPSPPQRVELAAAYDSANQEIVVFGGYNFTVTAPPTGILTLQDTWLFGPSGVIATANAFGSGCGNPAIQLVLKATGRPLLGQVGEATLTNCPSSIALVAMGVSDQHFAFQQLPMSLGNIGMPGCELWQSNDVFGLDTSVSAPGSLLFALSIPNAPALLNEHVYLQGFVLAPGANWLQVLASDAVDWLFGDQ